MNSLEFISVVTILRGIPRHYNTGMGYLYGNLFFYHIPGSPLTHCKLFVNRDHALLIFLFPGLKLGWHIIDVQQMLNTLQVSLFSNLLSLLAYLVKKITLENRQKDDKVNIVLRFLFLTRSSHACLLEPPIMLLIFL